MITSGFFDSIDHDRRYNAEQVSSIFDGIVRDGIFMTIGGKLQVRASSAENMNIIVSSGRCWFNHVWLLNDADLIMPVEISELLVDRIDAVVIDIDTSLSVRAGTIKIIKGEGSSSPQRPTLINEPGHYQYALAYISVKKDVSAILQADITNMVGSEPTPFVTGPLETIDATMLLAQWESQFQQFMNTNESEYTDWFNNVVEPWFETVKDTLSEDAAVALATKIVEIQTYLNTTNFVLSDDVRNISYATALPSDAGEEENASRLYLILQ